MPVSTSVLALSTDNLTNVPRAPATKPPAMAADAPAPEMPVVVPGVLAVPVQVWRALEARLATLESNERDTRKYLRAHLALEHGKREQARALERKYPASALQTSVPAAARPSGADAVPTRAAALVQATARGALERARVAGFRRQRGGATRLQAVWRGRAARRAVAPRAAAAAAAARIASLERQLGREKEGRKVQELALRKLFEELTTLRARVDAHDLSHASHDERLDEADARLDGLPDFKAWGAATAKGAADGDDDLYLSDGDLLSPRSRALATEVGA